MSSASRGASPNYSRILRPSSTRCSRASGHSVADSSAEPTSAAKSSPSDAGPLSSGNPQSARCLVGPRVMRRTGLRRDEVRQREHAAADLGSRGWAGRPVLPALRSARAQGLLRCNLKALEDVALNSAIGEAVERRILSRPPGNRRAHESFRPLPLNDKAEPDAPEGRPPAVVSNMRSNGWERAVRPQVPARAGEPQSSRRRRRLELIRRVIAQDCFRNLAGRTHVGAEEREFDVCPFRIASRRRGRSCPGAVRV